MLQLPTAQKAAPVAASPSTPMVAFTILVMVVVTVFLSSLLPAPERSKAASAAAALDNKNTPTESIGKPTDPSGIRAQLSSGVSSSLREEALQAGVPQEFIGRKPYLAEPILRSGNQQGHGPQLPEPGPDKR